MFIFSGLSLSRQSNGEKSSRFKIAADTLMTFAGELFTLKEIERQSRYNIIQIEVRFLFAGHDSDKPQKINILILSGCYL